MADNVADGRADGIRCMVMRGGTSKGLYFLAQDLPPDRAERDALLLRAMGSPDPRQIDGMGGAHPLTSKVAVVAPSAVDGVDVDYLFLQVAVDEASVSDRQTCGNLLAGIGPFSLERGLVKPPGPEMSDAGDSGTGKRGPSGAEAAEAEVTAKVRIRMLNTGGIAVATVPLVDGRPVYDGSTAISGVPGTAAPIRLDFEDVAGASCGALLPTGNPVDTVAGVEATLVDNGMPVVVLRASDLGVTGCEPCEQLESNARLRETLEQVRLAAGQMMNLGDVSGTTVPKLSLVAAPREGGTLSTRTFIPHRCHDAIGVLGAVSVATAALLPKGPASEVAELVVDGSSPAAAQDGTVGDDHIVVIEHPTGTFEAAVTLASRSKTTMPVVERAGIIRTARKLMDGLVFP